MFQKTVPLLAAVLLSLLVLAPAAGFAAAAPSLSKADVEKIVHDYIMAHPGDILDAVQGYQEQAQRDRQTKAVSTNRQTIYNDPLTPAVGNPDGDVTVVEFFDYNCGYCKKILPALIELMEQDKKVRVLFKDFPILGPSSETASKWALAAHKQKKYFEFHKALMENHAPITDGLLAKIAQETGMDVAKAKADVAGGDIAKQIGRNRSLAANMGLRGTPAFVVGEEVAPGAIGLDEMKALIAKARAGGKKEDGKGK